jgi:hypothetical protein
MTREDLAACALRALPVSIRAARGEEILGTLLDCAGTGSRVRFGRELADLSRPWFPSSASRSSSWRPAGVAWTCAAWRGWP